MDITLLQDLNDAQRRAVSVEPKPMLVLAGAGSGKTRVLVHRIAWLVRVMGFSPYSILAVTFTNKAAHEMRSRVEGLLGGVNQGLWMGTFHGIANRLLRQHWQEAKLPQTFQILDADDQQRLLKRILRDMQLDEARWPVKQIQWFINAQKDDGLRPADLAGERDLTRRTWVGIYAAYEQACQTAGVVDFAELLLRAYELLRDQPHLLRHYRERFQHILVDEFQDTNAIQYAWLRLVAGERTPVFVVGDDDQSIYGWRGAKVENVQRFTQDFAGCEVVRLEQNYRSTGHILAAANALIEHNNDRLGKKLWTDGQQGERVQVYAAFNEIDEARFVRDQILRWVDYGNLRSSVAILYRSNAQSRTFEDALLQAGIPYRVYGGLRFFERQEVKDALAYLRLIANRGDDPAFERSVNTPARGIGDRTLEIIRQTARSNTITQWQAAMHITAKAQLPARANNALVRFMALIDELAQRVAGKTLAEQVEMVLDRSGLMELYANDKDRAQARVENLQELVSAAQSFVPDAEATGMDVLTQFLSHAALEAGEGQAAEWEDCVQLMSLHSAKGLEFPLVFLCGLEEGLFPHNMSLSEPGRLAEERRLCYVGITRARERLVITYTESRRLHGRENYAPPSRFLHELPTDALEEIRPRVQVSRPWQASSQESNIAPARFVSRDTISSVGFKLGQRVRHDKFGEGVVLNIEGSGPNARVQINFRDVGPKVLIASYAHLQGV
jgi:DNA helicase II / ATP-dependent DNA helicase PcrA